MQYNTIIVTEIYWILLESRKTKLILDQDGVEFIWKT